MPNNGEPDGNGNPKANQYNALGLLQVLSFTANPSQVEPFGTTTLSWEVHVPTSLHLPTVTLSVAGQPQQGLSGSVSFALASTREFALTANTELASRRIGVLTVMVDESKCKVGSIQMYILKNNLTQVLNQQFQGGSQFSLRSGGVSVTAGDALILIAIPLTLNVPEWWWWNAAMDISIQLGVQLGAGGTVLVTAPSVDVHVTWTWVQDRAGCTEFGSQLAQALMTEIVNKLLVPLVAQALTSQVQAVADPDPAVPPKPIYALTSLDYSPDAITFTVCPTSPSMIVHPVGKHG